LIINVWNTFEEFFQRKVDLLNHASIKNYIPRNSIGATKILIDDGKE
jgi:hypothetical protein